MNTPQTPAQAAQQSNRDSAGRYQHKTHAEAEVELAAPAVTGDGVDHEAIDAELKRTLEWSVGSYRAFNVEKKNRDRYPSGQMRQQAIDMDSAITAALVTAPDSETGRERIEAALPADVPEGYGNHAGLSGSQWDSRAFMANRRRENLRLFREAGAVAGERLDEDALAEALPAGTRVQVSFASSPDHMPGYLVAPGEQGQVSLVDESFPDAARGWSDSDAASYHRIEGTDDVLAVDRFGIPTLRYSPQD